MKLQRSDIMGMPMTVEVIGEKVEEDIQKVFIFFEGIDAKYSPYKNDSVVSRINRGELSQEHYDEETKNILKLCEQTKQETDGYFDVWHHGKFDPSGLVKGWAIWKAADILSSHGHQNFYIEAGGDIQAQGLNEQEKPWQIGIRNPFKGNEVVKIVRLQNCGMATSGNYERGGHIYNPFIDESINEIVSLTVIGPNVYEADRFATPCFAMGLEGIKFLEAKPNLEGYMIDKNGIATMTSGFANHVLH